MHTFGYKIVEKHLEDIQPIVHQAFESKRPLEIGLYFGDAASLDFLDAELPSAEIPLNTHLDHMRLNIYEFDRYLDKFKRQLEQSVQWGAKYGITHISRSPMSARAAHKDRVFERLLTNTRLMEEVCAEFDFAVHVENTFHSLDFYREYFAQVKQAGLQRIHHCFDIGHAKIWTNQTLSEWLDLLTSLVADDFRLHFHLHANQGLGDDHMSFVKAQQMGITAPDSYTGERDYFQHLGDIAMRFPNSTKVFEVPAGEALANMDLVMQYVDQQD